MAEAAKAPARLGLLREAAQWPLKRYGRLLALGTGELPEPSLEAGEDPCKWKVFESNEESGYLVLTIVISGHFFISQGQTLLEGFSLIGSKDWLKVVRRMDCLLIGPVVKDQGRMFRVQFAGESQEQALGHCCSCAQSLAQYVDVGVCDGDTQALQLSPSSPTVAESPGKDRVQSGPLWPWCGSQQQLEQSVCEAGGAGTPEGRISVQQRAQSILASETLPPAYGQSVWDAEELGPFLRLCLMDQHFPAFVDDVEKELKKLTS
ncbi:meiotic recombination protein REC114 [Tupaia chinensis]|uniref:meiotic recombination protein REC114 n=1 Tax=Tupaia chinensis TaxID=246437 RepID=UPI0003C9013B|nr:meiotic recombination protein REC114 [Tupaia chinensis]